MQNSNTLSSAEPLSLLQATEQAFALSIQGKLPIADLVDTGHMLIDAKQLDMAIKLYRAWLEHNESPGAFAVRFNLGVLLDHVKDYAVAEDLYRVIIAEKPLFIEAYIHLGCLLELTSRFEEALAVRRSGLNFVDKKTASGQKSYQCLLNDLGFLLEKRKELPEAAAMLMRSLKLNPKQPDVILILIRLRQGMCEWPLYGGSCAITFKDMISGISAVAMLSVFDDPALQLKTAQRYVKERVLNNVLHLSSRQSYGHKRLRIGYLSGDFHLHPVSILTAELYSLHDRTKFEVFGFCFSPEDGSALRVRVIDGMDHFIKIGTINDAEAARLIRSYEIDILVDLHGITAGTRHDILSYRPAPVQMTWLGFPGTTALPEVDYVLSDPFVFPPELEPFFTEQPLHLPNTFQVNDRQRIIGACPTKESCGLPEDVFIFCSFNISYKITPEVFGVWMRILKRVPNSILWLVDENETMRENLCKYAKKHGIVRERLRFSERVMPADYLARLQVADLFLDTFPFGGGTTASDALWAGLPLLTCAGRTFASRMAGSLLQAVDLPELITYNFQDYEDKAVELAKHPERIAAMKQQLVDNRLTCVLFDTPRFVRDFEELCIKIIDALPSGAHEMPLSLPVDHGTETTVDVNLYHIAYSLQTIQEVGAGYKVLNNVDSQRKDWREYWPIRRFLLEEKLDDERYYGFFSPRFQEKTGLSYAQVNAFVQAARPDADVILFSPQPDMGAFFLNVFEQEELQQPGFIAASEAFLEAAGLPGSLTELVMDSRQIVFSNYFVARPEFWSAWLALNEKLFAFCEGEDSALKQALVFETSYPGSVQRKVFIMERIASLLLTLYPKWRVRAYNTFDCAWSASRLNQFKFEAVLSDALKIAMKEQGFHDYQDAFAKVRDRLR